MEIITTQGQKTLRTILRRHAVALLLCVALPVLGSLGHGLNSADAATITGSDGSLPFGGLVMDSAGNLYGTTLLGGTHDDGTVFKISATGTETVLHSFVGSDGKAPAYLIMDRTGNSYGTAAQGGAHGDGTVFKISATGTETVLHSFGGRDGKMPGAVLLGRTGSLYGTTMHGGAHHDGTVFKLSATGRETVLYSFKGPDGKNPTGNLVRDRAGNLYGTTGRGGAHGFWGTVFKISPAGRETLVHSFAVSDGQGPLSLTLDKGGNLYGTRGATRGYAGAVFKISRTGTETVLHFFGGQWRGGDGDDPEGRLILDRAGNLYGTTQYGGAHGDGTVFKINATGTATVLYSFAGGDGKTPSGHLVMDRAGNLYGTASMGGAQDGGVVFKISATGTETILHSFSDWKGPAAPSPKSFSKNGTATQVDEYSAWPHFKNLKNPPESLCHLKTEIISYSCRLANNKLVSVCASRNLSPHAGYIEYRYGLPGKIELAYPKRLQKPQGLFFYSETSSHYEDQGALAFIAGAYKYTTFYHYYDKGVRRVYRAGLSVRRGNKIVFQKLCKGNVFYTTWRLISRQSGSLIYNPGTDFVFNSPFSDLKLGADQFVDQPVVNEGAK